MRTSSRVAFAVSWVVFAVAVVLAWRKVLAVPDGRGDVGGLLVATLAGALGAGAARRLAPPARTAAVTDEPLPPYIEAPTAVPVRVTVRGEQRDGEVIGRRGERVYVCYRTEAGNHLGWVPAADVERS